MEKKLKSSSTSIIAGVEWQRLSGLCRAWVDRRVADCFGNGFSADPERARRLSAEAAGIFLDFSRQRIDAEVLDALFALAQARGLDAARAALWRGEPVNHTEDRAALHMALRAGPGDDVGDAATASFVAEQRARMREIVVDIRDGRWGAPDGGRFEHVIHVGIGGSHLGPALALDALDAAMPDTQGPQIHFVSSTDPVPLTRLMHRLPRERSLLVLVSKSFTTAETTLNGDTLIDWLTDGKDRATVLHEQVIGISANVAAMDKAGIPRERQLFMSEWVGGRYSLWSAVGLPVALRFGMDAFEELLAGARAMDVHFRDAEPRRNLPLLLGLIGVWNINFLDARTHAVIPYAEALAQLPAYLQQLEMESNGKRVDRDGRDVDYRTAPVIWGGVGMNGQHAFFQHLHQGTDVTPLDVILVGGPDHGLPRQRGCVLANGLAQTEALMRGQEATMARADDNEMLAPYRVFPGDRPSSTILLDALDARRLGALLALYEHKVFVQSVIWNLNPFDQFGVELGKTLARRLEPFVSGALPPADGLDPATLQLLRRLKNK